MTIKTSILFLFLSFLLLPFLVTSQSVLDVKISANFQNKDLSTILKRIGQQHQVAFFFKEADLPSENRNITFEAERLEVVLAELLSGTDLGFLDYRSYGVLIAPSKIIDPVYSAEYYQALEQAKEEDPEDQENAIIVGDKNNLNPTGKAIITGTVRDEATQEAIIGATLVFTDLNQGTATDEKGYFSITLPLGKHEFQIQYVGYSDLSRSFTVYNDGPLSLELSKGAVNLSEVIVKGKAADFNVANAQIGQVNLDIASLKKLPTFLGETDVVKGLLLQPGVSTLGEGAIGFNVRGGAVDQNLVMQNEGLIFNASHALGFFSTFNAELINKVTLYKGSIPAQYGGRLASVLDVEMREGDFQKFKMKGSISPVSSRLYAEAPVIKNKSSFIAGFRSTYSDWVLQLINVPEVQRSTVFFYDANLSYTHRLNEKNTLTFSAYTAKDDFGFNREFGFEYSTKMGQVSYKKIFSERLFSNLSATMSRYESTQLDLEGTDASRLDIDLNYYKIKEQLTFLSSDELKMEGGFSSILYQIEPGAISPDGIFSQVIPEALEREQSLESAIFANADWTISQKILVSAGLRFSYYQNLGAKTVFQYEAGALPSLENSIGAKRFDKGETIATYAAIEPRLSLRYRLNSETSIKIGYNRMTQYLNQIYNTNTATPTSQWQLSNLYIKPLRAHSFSLGYFRNLKDNLWETSAEVYFRSIDPLFDYVDFANLTVNEQIETELLPGIGRSYGIELSIKKTGSTPNIVGLLS